MEEYREIYNLLNSHISNILENAYKEAGACDQTMQLKITLSACQLEVLCHALSFYDENRNLQNYFDQYDEAYRNANQKLNDKKEKKRERYLSNAVAELGLVRLGNGVRHSAVKKWIVRDYQRLSQGLYALGYEQYNASDDKTTRRNNAVNMIMKKYGYQTREACIKALQRFGAKDLPSTWEKI